MSTRTIDDSKVVAEDKGYLGQLKDMTKAELIEHSKEFASQAGRDVNWLQAQLLVTEWVDRAEDEAISPNRSATVVSMIAHVKEAKEYRWGSFALWVFPEDLLVSAKAGSWQITIDSRDQVARDYGQRSRRELYQRMTFTVQIPSSDLACKPI